MVAALLLRCSDSLMLCRVESRDRLYAGGHDAQQAPQRSLQLANDAGAGIRQGATGDNAWLNPLCQRYRQPDRVPDYDGLAGPAGHVQLHEFGGAPGVHVDVLALVCIVLEYALDTYRGRGRRV